MKNSLLVLMMALAFVACKDEADDTPTPEVPEATIIGRWVPEGFENNVRYEFTSDTRYTMYADSTGIFPTLEEFRQMNPNLPGNPWEYSGDTVVVDLHFGNFSKLLPVYKCDNKVIDWKSPDGSDHSTYYRENHDISSCN